MRSPKKAASPEGESRGNMQIRGGKGDGSGDLPSPNKNTLRAFTPLGGPGRSNNIGQTAPNRLRIVDKEFPFMGRVSSSK